MADVAAQLNGPTCVVQHIRSFEENSVDVYSLQALLVEGDGGDRLHDAVGLARLGGHLGMDWER
jgi:hypothetical protein